MGAVERKRIEQAVMRWIGAGTSVSSLTHFLKTNEGMVVSKAQVQRAVTRLVRGGKLKLDPERTPKLYLPVVESLDEGRVTYHGRDGRFTRSQSAHTVTREGERFKMVRQLRRIGPRMSPEPPPEDSDSEVATEEEVEATRALRGLLAASPGWTSLHSVTEAVFGREECPLHGHHRGWKDIEDAERRGERRDPASTAHKPDEWYDSDVYADFEVIGEGRGDGDAGKLSKVKKKFLPHMIVISKDSGGDFIVTKGDPRKPSSKLVTRDSTVEGIRWWVRDNVGGKYGRYSHDHVYDATKLKLSPPVYSQWYVDNMMS